jgi:hypothetical protein
LTRQYIGPSYLSAFADGPTKPLEQLLQESILNFLRVFTVQVAEGVKASGWSEDVIAKSPANPIRLSASKVARHAIVLSARRRVG